MKRLIVTAASLLLSTTAMAQSADAPPADSEAVATIATGDGATPVAAQAAAAAPDDTRPKSRMIEEVVVTAQKREENLQDVPISVNAFTAGTLDAKGVAGIDSLPNVTPGLTINNMAGFSVMYLRGVGTDAFLMADPSVAAYIDGVYSPFTQGLGQDLGVLERIEVAKGPQGTLFGRNAVAGAINIVTRDPGPTAETSVQLSYANYNTLKTRIYTNIPFSDSVAVSIAGLYNDVGTYLDGRVGADPVPDESTKGARVKAKVLFSENLEMVVTGSISELEGIGSYAAPNASPSPVIGQALLLEAQDGYSTNLSAPAYSVVDTKTLSGNLTYTAEWFDTKLLGSRQDIQSRSLYEYDGSPLPIAEFEPRNFNAQFTTAELQFISNDTSWGNEWLEWIGGAYLFDGRQGFEPIDLIVAATDFASDRLFGVAIPPAIVDLLEPLQEGFNLPTGRIGLTGVVKTESYSAFGQATVHFTEAIAMTVGARYQAEKRNLVEATAGLQLSDGSTPVKYIDAPQDSATTTSLKPKISFDYRPVQGTLLYASYQQAIKSGTYNPINVLSLPSFARPEEMEAYELGIKTDLFDGLMRVNAAAFRYEITDLQVQFVSLFNGGVVSFENAGGSRIHGMDFDVTLQVLPDLVDDLIFTASGAYIPDAKYTSYKDASGFDPQTGIYSGSNDYTGNRTVRTPKVSGMVGLIKTFNVENGAFEIGGDLYYNSGYAYLAQGCALDYVCEESYQTLNVRASYLYDPWGLRVTIFGNNVTDEEYSSSKLITDFGANRLVAPPLTYGVRLNWDF